MVILVLSDSGSWVRPRSLDGRGREPTEFSLLLIFLRRTWYEQRVPQSTHSRRVAKLTNVPVVLAHATSDQAPGEETVQVNDQYAGGGPPPDLDSEHDQHQTGG